jgi:hypothetical protein
VTTSHGMGSPEVFALMIVGLLEGMCLGLGISVRRMVVFPE